MATLPDVGLNAVIENLAAFQKGADSISKAYDDINAGADSVEATTGLATGAITGLGGVASTVATGGLTLLVGAIAAVAAAAAGAVVGLGAMGKAAFDLSSEVETSQKDIQAQLGLTEEASKQLAETARDVWANNFAGSIEEATQALIEVRKQLKGISDEELQDATENAIRLSDAFGVDITESTNAANVLMQKFGLTQQEAFDFITKGFQEGLNTSDDFLESVTEYSNLFSQAGGDAGEFFSLLESGLQGGILGTDKAADLFKEFSIRIIDGSKQTTEGLEELGIPVDDFISRISSGELSVSEAFAQIQKSIAAIDDPIEQNRIGVALMGTQFEDLGAQAVAGLSLATSTVQDFTGATDSLNAQYQTLPQAFEGVKRQLLVAIQPIGDALLETANEVVPLLLDAIQDMKPALEDFAELLGEAITKAVQELIPWIQKKLIPAMKDLWKFIDKRVLPVVEDLWALFGDTKKTGKEVTKAFEKMNDVIEPFVKKTMEELLEIWEIIAKWVDKNWPLIEKTITVVMARIENSIEKTTKAIQKIWDKWGDEIIKITEFVFDAAFDAVKAGIENMLDIISAIMKLITGDYEGAWEDIERITERTFDTLNSIVKRAMDLLLDLIIKALRELKSKMEQAWNDIKSAVERIVDRMIDSIVSKIKSSVSAIQSAIITAFTNALNYVAGIIGNLSALTTMVSNLISSIANKIKALWDTIRSAISWAIQTALNAFNISTILGAVTSIANTVMNAIKAKLAAAWTLIRDGVTSAISVAAALIQVPITALKNIGDRIIQAIVDGINAAKREIRDILEDVADDIPGWLRDFLGIGSPAKVVIPIGQGIIQGIQEGIMMQVPNLTRQLQAAVAGPVINSTPVLGSSGPVNTTNVFNVGGNTIASNMDSAVFEARVLQVIKQNL